MKPYLFFIASSCLFAAAMAAEEAISPADAANTIILDEVGVKNLRLETVMVEERDFESTIFAIGRVEEIPGNQYSVSSRILGRAIEVNAFLGDRVKKGQVLFRVESRQPGDPPPVIELNAARAELLEWAKLAKEIELTLSPQAAEQTDLAEQAWRNGQGDLLSVLRSREQRLELAAARLDALQNFQLARVRYQTALGNP